MCDKRVSLPAAARAVVPGGLLTVASARAQAVPPPPVIGPAISGRAVLAGLSPCLGTVVPVSPVVAPVFDGGNRNADVDKDVDRSRTPGWVVIVIAR